jgi:hypothetical protein
MATGLSVHIGVNVVDPDHYGGWSGPLNCCEADADVMHEIAEAQGFQAKVLKTAEATRDAVADTVRSAAEKLESGDFFLLTYAGHGGQVTDVDGDEEDGKDETWCLYDGQFLDDELAILWSHFKEGVRVLLISDSCHSGSVSKGEAKRRDDEGPVEGTPRAMPRDAAIAAMRKNRAFYESLQLNLPSPRPKIRATVRLLSGCQDDQLSYEHEGNGMFTKALKKSWADGSFEGNYADLHKAIIGSMWEKQRPNHLVIGSPNAAYDSQKPFAL